MRKPIIYFIAGIGAAAIVVAAALLIALYKAEPSAEDVLSTYRADTKYGSLTISYPLDETLFPPEIAPPVFQWKDNSSKSTEWLVSFKFQDDQPGMSFLAREQQ